MNILYDHQIFQAQKFGGISRYFYELITRVAQMRGIRVSVFQGFHINQYGLDGEGFRRPEIPRTGRIFSGINNVLFRRFALRSRTDVYHPTYYNDPSPGLRAMRVLTVHDMIHELFPNDFPGDLTAQHKRLAVQKADWILALSESTKRDLVRILGTSPEKIKVVHLANSLRSEPSEKLVHRAPYFLFVGRRAGYKNFDLTLEALGRSSRLRKDFHLACFGWQPFSAIERGRIKKLGLEGRVIHFSGADAVLASLYKNAGFFICPSRYEGFGLAILEAMHYCCPVICSNTSSLPEVAGDAAIYFDPSNLESMIYAMEKVAYSTETNRALASAGPVREAQFSWDHCARETVAIYGK